MRVTNNNNLETKKRKNKEVRKSRTKKPAGIKLTARDLEIFYFVWAFKFCLSRHINALCGFPGARATTRRLRLLVETGYLARKKHLYGIPYQYSLTYQAKMLIGVNKRIERVRLDQINHDIYVIDALIYFSRKFNLSLSDITSEKALHVKDGFGIRHHAPDFIFTKDNITYAVEVELTPKSKERMRKNIHDNYLTYDYQYWITSSKAVNSLITFFRREYANIEVINLKEVIFGECH